jgi:riboflavin-specific deaminase-like protein
MARPFVCINMAATADGKITSSARDYPSFTSAADRSRMDLLRAEADAILVGAATLRADDPPLHVRGLEAQHLREQLGKPAGLLRVLVTASGRLDGSSRFFDAEGAQAGRIIATPEAAAARAAAIASGRAEIWSFDGARVDLVELLRRLAERGVERLLVEGGGELNWGFVRAGLVDELYVTIAPVLLGGREAPTLLEGDGLSMDERVRLRLLAADRVGDELFCRYAVEP